MEVVHNGRRRRGDTDAIEVCDEGEEKREREHTPAGGGRNQWLMTNG